MIIFLKWVLVILHIITAAAWFGIGLQLAGRVRQLLTLDAATAQVVGEDIGRSVRYMNLFLALTFVFALGAFLTGGGFAAYGPPYHTSLLLILIFLLIQFLLIRPAWNTIQSSFAGDVPADKVASSRKRIAMGVGIGHLLWLVLLVLMFWTRLGASF